MIRRLGFVWKMLPPWLRLKLIRVTQNKFTASAAAVVTNDQGKVLLLDHVLRPFSGWGLPGGFMSVGEQPEETIRRELREETGIELDALTMVRIRTLSQHVEIIFSAKALGEPEVMSREILALGWFDVDAMPTKMSSAQKKLIREVISSI
ncbi:MAG: NUDIX domain-containing protein [Acidobacteriota bacterium]